MIISGIQKTTLVDYPGKVAATVFTRGCSFRCPFCHNPELVISGRFLPELPLEDFWQFLDKRQGKLEGICITGGEPMLYSDIDHFIKQIKERGFAVKLDTNGSFPDRLEKVIKDGTVDYIAMDIKGPIDRYAEIARPIEVGKKKSVCHSDPPAGGEESSGAKNNLTIQQFNNKILRSIALIMSSGIDYEFRTTIVKPLHSMSDFAKIGEMIKGAPRYYIQNFVQSKHNDEDLKMQAFTDAELVQARIIMKQYVKEIGVR